MAITCSGGTKLLMTNPIVHSFKSCRYTRGANWILYLVEYRVEILGLKSNRMLVVAYCQNLIVGGGGGQLGVWSLSPEICSPQDANGTVLLLFSNALQLDSLESVWSNCIRLVSQQVVLPKREAKLQLGGVWARGGGNTGFALKLALNKMFWFVCISKFSRVNKQTNKLNI